MFLHLEVAMDLQAGAIPNVLVGVLQQIIAQVAVVLSRKSSMGLF
jgi:hypothetical protein